MSEETASKKKSKRRNGDGTTYRYKNGWRTVILYKGQQVTAMGRSEQESRRLAKAKLAVLPAFNADLVPSAAKLTVEEFLPSWLENKHRPTISETTYRRYESLIRIHVLPALGELKIQAVNKHHINALMGQMKQANQGDRSRQQARAVLSAAFSDAVEDDLIHLNPVSKSRRIDVDTPQIHPLTLEEVKKLLNTNTEPKTQARLRIAVLYGLRQGEALGLTWSSIDFEKKTLFVWQQAQKVRNVFEFVKLKTESSVRTLELDDETVAALKAHKVAQNSYRLAMGDKWEDLDLVFPGLRGQMMNSSTDHRQWHTALANAGLPLKRLHDARHTAATLLFDQGLDIEVIRRFMGHSSVLLTSKTYVHHSARQMQGVAKAISSMAI